MHIRLNKTDSFAVKEVGDGHANAHLHNTI